MKRAMIVDDVEVSRYILRSLLEGEGFEVKEAQDEAEATRLSTSFMPDVVFLDWHLKKTVASGLLSGLRKSLQTTAKIIVVSGVADKDETRQVKELNIDGFVAKPVGKENIRQALEAAGMCSGA